MTMTKIWAHYQDHPSIEVELVTGGLFHPAKATSAAFADGKRPIAERVSALFGVPFAEAYFRNVLGSGHLDSRVPCQSINAVAALQSPDALPFAHRLMEAAFVGGRDISQREVCMAVAGEHGLDQAAVEAAFESDGVTRRTDESFALARRIGTGFPALLLREGGQLHHLGGANLTVESLRETLEGRRGGTSR